MTTTVATPAVSVVPAAEDQRERFYRLMPELMCENTHLALVLAEIGAGYLDPAATAPVADRVINVGIREQLMLGVAGGLALTGMRPVVHTFPPFLVERPFEQVKLDLGHQGVGAVLPAPAAPTAGRPVVRRISGTRPWPGMAGSTCGWTTAAMSARTTWPPGG